MGAQVSVRMVWKCHWCRWGRESALRMSEGAISGLWVLVRSMGVILWWYGLEEVLDLRGTTHSDSENSHSSSVLIRIWRTVSREGEGEAMVSPHPEPRLLS